MSDILINLAWVYAVVGAVVVAFTIGNLRGQGDGLGRIHHWVSLALIWPLPVCQALWELYRDRRNG